VRTELCLRCSTPPVRGGYRIDVWSIDPTWNCINVRKVVRVGRGIIASAWESRQRKATRLVMHPLAGGPCKDGSHMARISFLELLKVDRDIIAWWRHCLDWTVTGVPLRDDEIVADRACEGIYGSCSFPWIFEWNGGWR
jgi:hypothetical protein